HLDLMERRNGHFKMCQWEVLDPAEAAAAAAKKAAEAQARADAAKVADVPLPRPRPAESADAKSPPAPGAPATAKERKMRAPVALSVAASIAAASTMAHAEERTVTVGPWTVAASYKGDTFEDCSMSRPADELGVMFVRAQDGLALMLDSGKWKLERGRAYP